MDHEHLQVFAEFLSALSKADAGQEKQAVQDLTQLAVRTHMWGHIHAEILRIRARLYYQSGFIFLALVDLQSCLRLGNFYRRDRGDLLLLLANCYAELRRPKLVATTLRRAYFIRHISARSALKSLHNFGVRCNLPGESHLEFRYLCLVVHNEAIASNWIFCNALINRGCWLGNEGHYGLAEDDF